MSKQSMELAVMFIRNCPDKNLSLLFMSKPQCERTACEVQDLLDEFLRDRKACEGPVYQHAITTVLRITVVKGIHDEAGQQGQQRSLWLARQRFYWDTLGGM
ncbi:hypothetical protein NFI96_028014 [Prochilodus magdalenae]|nr:hypothetical protein NFI96_028014 [Prochilodus magdalenae]